jgi:hypothetical protein
MTDDWLGIASIILSLLVPLGLFVGRHWIMARISRGVQHQFDREIEALRADFRASEEQLKSDLRNKESEIASLRNSVLAGSASRQALLDKRRFQAVEKVWTDINDLAQIKGLSSMMALLNFKVMAREANDPRMQTFLSTIGAAAPDIKELKNVARDEQPVLPELAWAYFAAYKSILYGNLLRYQLLKGGVDQADKYLTDAGLRQILKATLPHQNRFIDEHESETYHYLLDEIERLLLSELRNILEGRDADQAATMRAKEIMDAVSKANEEGAEKAAANFKGNLP